MFSQNLFTKKAFNHGRQSIHHQICLLLPLVVLLSVCCLAVLGMLCRPGPDKATAATPGPTEI